MTANAPQMKGKRKIPCDDVALSIRSIIIVTGPFLTRGNHHKTKRWKEKEKDKEGGREIAASEITLLTPV